MPEAIGSGPTPVGLSSPKQQAQVATAAARFAAQLFADLNRTIATNSFWNDLRRFSLTASIAWPLAGGAVFGIVQALS